MSKKSKKEIEVNGESGGILATTPIDATMESEASEGEEFLKERPIIKVKQNNKCSYCEKSSADCTKGKERFKRYHLSWVDVVHIALFNLTHENSGVGGQQEESGKASGCERGPQTYEDGRVYFHYKADVAKYIDNNWSYFWNKARGETWINSASSALSTNSTENVSEDGRFESGKAKYNKNGMWALADDARFPSSYDVAQQQRTRSVVYDISQDGLLIPLIESRNNSNSFSGSGITATNEMDGSESGVSTSISGYDFAAQFDGSNSNAPSRKRKKSENLHTNSNLNGNNNNSTTTSSFTSSYRSKKYKQRQATLYSAVPIKIDTNIADIDTSQQKTSSRSEQQPEFNKEQGHCYVFNNEWRVKMWPDLPNPSDSDVCISKEPTHSAPQIKHAASSIWNEKGYRMAKSSHGTSTGSYYFEVLINPDDSKSLSLSNPNPNPNPNSTSATVSTPTPTPTHTSNSTPNPTPVLSASKKKNWNLRIGISTISGDLQAPCGYDCYSYSMRLNPPTKFHKAIGEIYGDSLTSGDVLGVLLHLPAELSENESRDLEARLWQPTTPYKPFFYSQPFVPADTSLSTIPPIPIVDGSELVFFKNGVCLGVAYSGLHLGKYYAAISSYNGGRAVANFGKPVNLNDSTKLDLDLDLDSDLDLDLGFKYPPPKSWKNSKVLPFCMLSTNGHVSNFPVPVSNNISPTPVNLDNQNFVKNNDIFQNENNVSSPLNEQQNQSQLSSDPKSPSLNSSENVNINNHPTPQPNNTDIEHTTKTQGHEIVTNSDTNHVDNDVNAPFPVNGEPTIRNASDNNSSIGGNEETDENLTLELEKEIEEALGNTNSEISATPSIDVNEIAQSKDEKIQTENKSSEIEINENTNIDNSTIISNTNSDTNSGEDEVTGVVSTVDKTDVGVDSHGMP
ncbi:Protein TRAUCO [Zancudomyces culisetae]|uniref:Protein TRAUCO n=1 Tax=Zancudomyces culisetae TaxID=1213189 RepID=A0A1R1PCN4_ZANCU|nr:Protein TRAUCO [Zancudomyces culisetae]|eukprot:OMH78736.1 Protein TRAUCO [Zancudomyces culisetae]